MLDWLRERTEHPRCAALLQQIMEWSGELQQAERRTLAKAQKMTIKRQAQDSIQQFREAVACFQFSASRGASEHTGALASEAKHVLNGSDVVDLQTLSIFRTQTTQTQRAVEAAMTELGWLDDATAERA